MVLGDAHLASATETLRSMGVTHILNVSADCPSNADGFVTLHVPLLDRKDFLLLYHLGHALLFVQNIPRDSVLLVHCLQGVSRSAATMCAILMYFDGQTFDSAFSAVKAVSPQAQPNTGFIDELQMWSRMKCSLLAYKAPPDLIHPRT